MLFAFNKCGVRNSKLRSPSPAEQALELFSTLICAFHILSYCSEQKLK